MSTIRQILFVPPAPLVWAGHLGAFAVQAIEVETTPTVSAEQIGLGLAQGTWDIGIGAMDDVIAWRSEQGADLRLAAQLERRMVMRFCAAPAQKTLRDAAQGTIAVDSTTSGFVFVLYRAMEQVGIDRRRCRYAVLGGVKQRFDALLAGEADSAILVPPFDEMARARGFHVLWRGEEVAPDYPGVVVAVRTAFLADNPDAMRRYLAALRAANDWAGSAENAAEARRTLLAAGYSEAAADRLVGESVPGLEPSLAGWDETVALRRECGLLPDPAPDAATVIDTRLLQEARRPP
jgi:ABC-type nitrate/sulfonate/bicarbonate transport system substrate-binding protein